MREAGSGDQPPRTARKLPRMALFLATATVLGFVLAWFWHGLPTTPHVDRIQSRPTSFDSEQLSATYEKFENLRTALTLEDPKRDSVSVIDVTSAIAPVEDSEWQALPKKRWPSMPGYILYGSPYAVKVSSLYRDDILNPLDAYISPRDRQDLQSIVMPRLERLGDVVGMYNQAVTQEMNKLIELGIKTPLRLRKGGRGSSPSGGEGVVANPDLYENGESIDTFYGVGNTLYGFSYSDAPGVRTMVDMIRFLRADLAGVICNWFSARGLMSSAEVFSYMDQVTHFSMGVTR